MLLNNHQIQKKDIFLDIVKSKKKTKAEINEVISFVSEYGGMEYAELKMNQYRDKALAILDSYPDSEVKESLKGICSLYNFKKKIGSRQPSKSESCATFPRSFT